MKLPVRAERDAASRLVFWNESVTRETGLCPKLDRAELEVEFDWDEGNIGHLARHKVLPEEAEQVMLNNPVDVGMETSKVRSAISTLARQPKAAYFWW